MQGIWTPDILTGHTYIELNSLKSREECEMFLSHEDIIGNRLHFIEAFSFSFDYEDQRKDKKKVYAKELIILIPRCTTKNELTDIVKNFMVKVSPLYEHQIPYAFYKFNYSTKNGEFVHIIAGQREVYDEPRLVTLTTNKTTYLDKTTRKFCSKDNPNVLVVPIGTPKLDKNGNEIKQLVTVSSTKDDGLRYKASTDKDLNKQRHSGFIAHLRQMFLETLCDYVNIPRFVPWKKKIKKERVKRSHSKQQKAKIIRFNVEVVKLNYELSFFRGMSEERKCFLDVSDYEHDLMKLSSKINQIFKSKHLRIKKGEEIWVEKYQRFQKNQSKHDEVYDFDILSENDTFTSWSIIFERVINEIKKMISKFRKDYEEEFFGVGQFLETLEEHRKSINQPLALQ